MAIDSALKQTYPNAEVVVVDDGSTDRSQETIASYDDRIISVFKENGGQASSLNAGVEASSGEVLCFLDADDIFYPHKVETIVDLLAQIVGQNEDVLLNNFLETIDHNEMPTNVDIVNEILSGPGEWQFLRELGGKSLFFDGRLNQVSTPAQVHRFAANYRFVPYLGVQTSGITLTRSLANKVFPLPAEGIRISADVFLVKGASLYGAVYSTTDILTKYRLHGSNNWYGRKSKKEFKEVKYFFSELNNFLNLKLVAIGKEPVFSYLDSMSAKGYYRYYFGYQSYNQLFDLALKVLSWRTNLITINFFAKTTLLAMYFKFKCSLAAPES